MKIRSAFAILFFGMYGILEAQISDFNPIYKPSPLKTVRSLFNVNVSATGGYSEQRYWWRFPEKLPASPFLIVEDQLYKQADGALFLTLSTPIINVTQSFTIQAVDFNGKTAGNISQTSIDCWGILNLERYLFQRKYPTGDYLKSFGEGVNGYFFLPRWDLLRFNNPDLSYSRSSFMIAPISYIRETEIRKNVFSNINNIEGNFGSLEIRTRNIGFATRPILEQTMSNVRTFINMGYSSNDLYRNAVRNMEEEGSFGSNLSRLMMKGLPMINYEIYNSKSEISVRDQYDNIVSTHFLSGVKGHVGLFSYGFYTFGKVDLFWIANFYFWGHQGLTLKNEVAEYENTNRFSRDNYARIFLNIRLF
jgi:hypothetical protein